MNMTSPAVSSKSLTTSQLDQVPPTKVAIVTDIDEHNKMVDATKMSNSGHLPHYDWPKLDNKNVPLKPIAQSAFTLILKYKDQILPERHLIHSRESNGRFLSVGFTEYDDLGKPKRKGELTVDLEKPFNIEEIKSTARYRDNFGT